MKYSAPVEVNELNCLEKFGFNNIVAAIGVFDGIHLGHRAIISRLLVAAEEYDAVPVVITFHPHPRHFLIQESTLKLLRSQKSKVELLGQLGIKAVVTVNFTEKISGMPPEQFVDYLIKDNNIKLKAICVGENWKFGAEAKGDVKLLERLAEKKGFKLYSVEQVFLDGILVSSTRIRKELTSARFDIAYKMLDCNYRMEGRVIKSSPETKCVVDYGIVPHYPRNYKIDLFTDSMTIPLNVMIDKQNIKENSIWVQDADGSKLKDREIVEIFLKP
jgi:FAD synthase